MRDFFHGAIYLGGLVFCAGLFASGLERHAFALCAGAVGLVYAWGLIWSKLRY